MRRLYSNSSAFISKLIRRHWTETLQSVFSVSGASQSLNGPARLLRTFNIQNPKFKLLAAPPTPERGHISAYHASRLGAFALRNWHLRLRFEV